MSEHDSKRYFWLKLKEDFFDDDAISWLEDQPNGKEYALFYLKLCLKSLKHDGVLIRTVGNILVPYDAKKLSEITRTNEDTVIVALELLKNIGLIEIQENGALFLTQLQSLIGSETNAAERMRNARAKAKELGTANNVRGMFAHCSPELDIDIDIEKDKDNKSGKPDYAQEREEIINYLNEKSGKAYRPNSDKTKKLISARLNEGFTVQDFKTVIDNKVSSWFGNKDMEKFLRPETLFGTKFEGYLNEGHRFRPEADTSQDNDDGFYME
jgi:uncharacterized phage protein (TIGR02220 family)/predicted phage replisome organizer